VCDTEGPWELVHPTFGTVKSVACLGYEVVERTDLGRVFEVRLNLIVTGKRLFPVVDPSTYDESDANASALQTSALANFISSTAAAIQQGAAIVQAAVNTALGWYQFAVNVVNGVKSIINAVSGLFGNFGRLFGGGNDGYAGSNTPAPAGSTVDSLLVAATVSRGAVVSTGLALQAAMANPSDSATLGAALQAFVAAVAAASADPADAINSLLVLSQYQPVLSTAPGQLGAAMVQMQTATGALFRRYALAQLAITTASYQPSSQQDAGAMIDTVTTQIDNEITVAGDAGDDASYEALRTLRHGVVSDLQTRGASLASIAGFSFQASLPSLVLANRIYRDATREPGLVQQANPVHPAFMPRTFQALAT
jgi:prophage DNA circulation protein